MQGTARGPVLARHVLINIHVFLIYDMFLIYYTQTKFLYILMKIHAGRPQGRDQKILLSKT